MPNTINEAAKSYILEGSAVVKKWGQTLTEVNKQLVKASRSPLSMEGQTALAKLLNNTQDRINYELRESTQNMMVGPYKMYAKDIVAGMIPNLCAMDLVSVQPIENKQGIINYVKFSAGSNKGGVNKGDMISSTFEYGDVEHDYTASTTNHTIDASAITAASSNLTFRIPWAPVRPNSVRFVVGGTLDAANASDIVTDSGSLKDLEAPGSLMKSGASVGTINYLTGEVTVAGAAVADIDIAYEFYNEYAPMEVPELDLSIESELIVAKSRKLKALWSFDAQYELQKEYGQDIGALLAAQAAGEIAHEIDTEICFDLLKNAHTQSITWSAETPYGVSQAQHFESLKTAFNRASRSIYQKTKRATGNFAIVGTNVATVIESTPSFIPNAMGSVVGPYLLGTWGAYKIYVNPFLPADSFVVGYKGDNLFEAGYVYAPYIPVATTQMLMLADFQGQQGWATSYGKKMLNNKFYAAGSITNLS